MVAVLSDAPVLAFYADVHVGNPRTLGGAYSAGVNVRCSDVLTTLRHANALVRDLGVDSLIVLGDLFDTTHERPQVIAEALHAYTRVFEPGDTRLAFIKGNHDSDSEDYGDHALGVLDAPELQRTVIDESRVFHRHWEGGEVDVLCLPFTPGIAAEAVRKQTGIAFGEVPRVPGGLRVLAMHHGIIDDTTPFFLKESQDAVPLAVLRELQEEYAIDAVFAGDWHRHKDHGSVMQVGALAPTGFDNPGVGTEYGNVALMYCDGRIAVRNVPGPRFVTVHDRDGIEAALAEKTEHCKLYVRWKAPHEELAEARAYMEDLATQVSLLGDSVVHGWEVVPDQKEARAAVRTAALEARSAETSAEAVAAFVASLQLDNEADRPSVLDAVIRYLG